MGISIAWEDAAQTIMRMTFAGQWTNEELRSQGVQAILMVRNVRHPVYVINDFRSSDSLPFGVLWQARDLNQIRPDNWAASITVTQDGLVRNLISLFGGIYLVAQQDRLRVVETLDEVYAIIEKYKSEEQVS